MARSVPCAPDPLALFARLTGGSQASDTLLLESLDATTKQAERSFLLTRCSLRAECRGDQVTICALTDNGRRALPALASALEERATSVARDGDTLTARYPAPKTQASERERLAAPSPFDALRALASAWTLLPGPTSPSLLAAGVFSYDMLECFEQLPGGQDDPLEFPEFVFWLPETLLVIDHRRRSTTAIALVHGGEGAEEAYGSAAGEIQSLASLLESPLNIHMPNESPPTSVETDIDDAAFAELVSELKERIVAGDVFQIVPSRTFSAACPDPLSAYARLRTLNPSPYMFLVQGPKHTVFGASPETCVKVSGSPRIVEIRPIAGTARRGRLADGSPDLDLDGRLEAQLRLDEKELAEHMMLIDLARNDVARVSKPGTRNVPRLLTVDRYSHVMHLVSYVAGELQDDLDALHAYAAGMNMGTLVGAPKLRAAELLREREATRRGPYGGAVGYLTHEGELDTAIIIRSATVKDGVAYVRAGAGVVYDSVPESEARETRSKAQAVLNALGATA